MLHGHAASHASGTRSRDGAGRARMYLALSHTTSGCSPLSSPVALSAISLNHTEHPASAALGRMAPRPPSPSTHSAAADLPAGHGGFQLGSCPRNCGDCCDRCGRRRSGRDGRAAARCPGAAARCPGAAAPRAPRRATPSAPSSQCPSSSRRWCPPSATRPSTSAPRCSQTCGANAVARMKTLNPIHGTQRRIMQLYRLPSCVTGNRPGQMPEARSPVCIKVERTLTLTDRDAGA